MKQSKSGIRDGILAFAPAAGPLQTIKNALMNLFIKLFWATSVVLFLNACSGPGSKDDDHTVKTKNTPDAAPKAAPAAEAAPTIASLTQEQIEAVGITYGAVEMKELTATIKANGNLRVPNDRKANATSLYGGAVKTIHVQVGDYVRKGQVIATIANPQFIQLQEEYLTTGSRIVFAEQEYARQQELFDNNAGAKKNLQNAATELKTLLTRRASLQKQIQLMGISPTRVSNSSLKAGLTVTAPISGTISNVTAQIGSYVDVSSPLAEIVDNASLHLDLNIFEKDLPLLKVGQTIHFTLTNNPATEYDAEIFSIGAAFENESKTIPVHARVKGNKSGLIDGMNITGIVSLNNALTPAVPDDAVVNADGKYYIFMVTDKEPEAHQDEKKGSYKEKPAKIRNFEKIEIVKGVSDMGYTAITPVSTLPKTAEIVTKGAFFINAKLSNTGEHDH